MIESLRGKRGNPTAEAADVLLVLMSITESAGIAWSDVLKQTEATCLRLETCARYPGELLSTGEVASPASGSGAQPDTAAKALPNLANEAEGTKQCMPPGAEAATEGARAAFGTMEPKIDSIDRLAVIIRRVDANTDFALMGAPFAFAEEILRDPDAAAVFASAQPPAPAPGSDEEREEVIEWLTQMAQAGLGGRDELNAAAAATLLRNPAPAAVPVPVVERPWEQDGWCNAHGRCWWSHGPTPIARWNLLATDDFDPMKNAMGWMLPHWAIPLPLPLPRPPQGGEVQP